MNIILCSYSRYCHVIVNAAVDDTAHIPVATTTYITVYTKKRGYSITSTTISIICSLDLCNIIVIIILLFLRKTIPCRQSLVLFSTITLYTTVLYSADSAVYTTISYSTTIETIIIHITDVYTTIFLYDCTLLYSLSILLLSTLLPIQQLSNTTVPTLLLLTWLVVILIRLVSGLHCKPAQH